jgi:hypothetical protein
MSGAGWLGGREEGREGGREEKVNFWGSIEESHEGRAEYVGNMEVESRPRLKVCFR